MRWLERILYYIEGRYGIDELTKFLAIIGMLLLAVSNSYEEKWIRLIATVILTYGALRPFSKEITNRQKELQMYQRIKQKCLSILSFRSKDKRDRKDRKVIIVCPTCGQKLRIPKGKKLKIKCSQCGREFIEKV